MSVILESVQSSKPGQKTENSAFLFNEVQLILAEKRTALSSLRAGIVPLLVLNAALIFLACYLIIHSIRRIHRYDRLIRDIKRKHSAIADLIA